MNTQPHAQKAPATEKRPDAVLSPRPRLNLTFGDVLTVSYSHLANSGSSVSYSLEHGEEHALNAALKELQLNVGEVNSTVECWLPLRDIRLSRGMAGSSSINGQIDSKLVAECIDKARMAAADVSPGWAGSRIWGEVTEIVVDGKALKSDELNQLITGETLRAEVLEAFYIPEIEASRAALLLACGLHKPTRYHLQIVAQTKAFTTQEERNEGIATLYLGRNEADIAVAEGGRIIAMGICTTSENDPIRVLFDADTWLAKGGWSRSQLLHGIRLLGNGLSIDLQNLPLTRLSIPVSQAN